MEARRLVPLVLAALLMSAGDARGAVEIEEASAAPRPFVELVNRGPGPVPVTGLTVVVNGCVVAVTGEPLARGQHHLIGLPGYAGLPGPDQLAACPAAAPFDVRLGDVPFLPAVTPPDPQNRGFVDADFDGVRDSIFVTAAPGEAAAGPLLSGLDVRSGRARFVLGRPARVTLRVERCARVRQKACAVTSMQRAQSSRRGSTGPNSMPVPGLRSLAPGRYRVIAIATDAEGRRTEVRAPFSVPGARRARSRRP